MTRTQFLTELKKMVKIINFTIVDTDPLFLFVCDEIIDRVIVYLNYSQITDVYDQLLPLVRIIARVVNGIYLKSRTESDNDGQVEQGINSMSDNGQSVNFSSQAKLYLNTATDQDVFSGFTDLLNTYRLANVL